MSLLLKALKHAERQAPSPSMGPEWTLAPREDMPSKEAAEAPARAAADLIRARGGEDGERRRLIALLAVLIAVVVGLAAYFYVAVYMPWLLLPKPPAVSAASASAPVATSAAGAQPLAQAASPLASAAASLEPARSSAATLSPPPANAREKAPSAVQSAPVQAPPTVARFERGPLVRAEPRVGAQTEALVAAHALLGAGRLDEAARAYEILRVSEPTNPDVWLGLAVIAEQRGQADEAARLYARVLELDPGNAYAQAALVGLLGAREPTVAEARLKELLARQPAAYLYFVLGNLHAGEGRWSEAQAAYFEAHRLEPEVADYAFNLAVSLEHLGLTQAAAEYYQRALRAARAGGAHFDPTQAERRLKQLGR
jgi:tetratricopeptide (TPR) repeat protein